MENAENVGTHLIVDAWSCPTDLLDDLPFIEKTVVEAVSVGGGTLIDICVHKFSPHGVTANASLAESHISVHTWPELGYFAADLFFCGKGDPERALACIESLLKPKRSRVLRIERGAERVNIQARTQEKGSATLSERFRSVRASASRCRTTRGT